MPDRYGKSLSTAELCRRLSQDQIFDRVWYKSPRGQRGTFVEVRRKVGHVYLGAHLRRESTPSRHGYNATNDASTRITYLSIRKEFLNTKHRSDIHFLGIWDEGRMSGWNIDRYEKDAKDDPEVKGFIEDILKYFN